MKKNSIKLCLRCGISLALLLLLLGCGPSDIQFVQDGKLKRYRATTVGKAFNLAFDAPSWTAIDSKNGERIVEFTGVISSNLHYSAIKNLKAELSKMGDGDRYKKEMQLIAAYANKIGGPKADFFQPFKERYAWELLEVLSMESNEAETYDAECVNSSANTLIFADAITDGIMPEIWKIGTPVTIQFIVSPDGESFEIKKLESAAWKRETADSILAQIYK